MGYVFSKVWTVLFSSDEETKIMILGLNNAGKTTLLYRLHLGEVVSTQPTIGSNVESVVHNKIHLQAWDLGGQEKLRGSWSTYLENTKAVVYVVDSNDQESFLLAKLELMNVLLNERLKDIILLVFANKQDVRGASDAGQICEDLALHSLRSIEWHIQGCSALTGEGVEQGLDWLTNRLVVRRNQKISW